MPLTVGNVTVQVNSLIDDQLPSDQILAWLNDALAELSEASNAIFPELTQDTDTFPIPDRWVRQLVIPFASGRAKQQDSSQFEYTDLYNQFLDKITIFTSKWQAPDDYKMLKIGQTLTLPDQSTYVIQQDDTLSSIATANATTVQDIKDANTTTPIPYEDGSYDPDYLTTPDLFYVGSYNNDPWS